MRGIGNIAFAWWKNIAIAGMTASLCGCLLGGGKSGGGDNPAALLGSWYTDLGAENEDEIQETIFNDNTIMDKYFTYFYDDASGSWKVEDTLIYTREFYQLESGMIHVLDSDAYEGEGEELFLKYQVKGDTLTEYKGLLLTGSSGTLPGVWHGTYLLKDSAGNAFEYEIEFTSGGKYYERLPHDEVDSANYTVIDGSTLELNRSFGVDTPVGYEISGGKLSIYGLNSKKVFHRNLVLPPPPASP